MKQKIIAKLYFGLMLMLLPLGNLMAQTYDGAGNTSFVNFTPQFFICIIAGVLLAMGFQVVLTILSVASGVSLIGDLEKPSTKKDNKDLSKENNKPEKPGTPLLVMITTGAGIWTILTASISLFFACLLAVKLSLISTNSVGVTLGLVIWATFFIMMMYLEIKSVSSLIGGVFNTALQGIRYSFSTFQKVFGKSPEDRIAAIAGNTVSKLGKEFSSAINDSKITKKVDKYLKDIKPNDFDYEKIKKEAINLFKNVEIEERVDRTGLGMEQKHFYKIAEANKKFNKNDVFKIAQILTEAWGIYKFAGPVVEKVMSGMGMNGNGSAPSLKDKVEEYLRSTGKAELSPEKLREDFQTIIIEPRLTREVLAEKVQAIDKTTLIGILAKRADMTQDEANRVAETVTGALAYVKDRFIPQPADAVNGENKDGSMVQKATSKIENKLRDYVTSLDKPGLDYDQIKDDMVTLFQHPKASFTAIKTQMGSYDKETLIQSLIDKEDISQEEATKIVSKIDEARSYVLQKYHNVENEVLMRADQAKAMALHEAEIIRKSAATAAWWLFATAIVSGIASAAGGYFAIM